MGDPDDASLESRSDDPGPAILVVADAAVADLDELPPRVRAEIDAATEVYVVTPSLPGRLAWLASELNKSRHAADGRLDTVLDQMLGRGQRVQARPHPDRTAQL